MANQFASDDVRNCKIEFDDEDDNWMLAASVDDNKPAIIGNVIDQNIVNLSPSTGISDVEVPKDSSQGLYRVLSSVTERSDKFNTTVTNMTIKVNEITSNPQTTIMEVFNKILKEELGAVNAKDRVGITLTNQSYTKPFYISLRERDQLTADVILLEVERVVQSNENFFLNEALDIKISTVHLPNGQARKNNLHFVSYEKFCEERKYSIVRISNDDDNLCLPRALVAGIAYLRRSSGEITRTEYKKIVRYNRPTAQKIDALELCRKANVDLENFRGTLEDVDKFQKYLRDYEITVFKGSDRKGRTILYRGGTNNEKYLDLIMDEQHYNAIINLRGAFGYSYYCRSCLIGYNNINEHRCETGCIKCRSSTECEPMEGCNIKCPQCNFYFKNQQCFDNHKMVKLEHKKSVCNITKYCYNCDQVYTLNRKKARHVCGYHVCTNCGEYVPREHLCFVQKKKKKDQKREELYIFFDFEARVENGVHIPNYCVVQHQCTSCINNIDISEDCNKCGEREYIIKKEGQDLLTQFFNVIINKSLSFKKVFVFAHNGGGYDFHFILNYMIHVKGWVPEKIIKNGELKFLKC